MSTAIGVRSITPNCIGNSIMETAKKMGEEIDNAIAKVKEKRQSKKDEKLFKTIREDLILKAFGITPEKFEEYKKSYADAMERLKKINEDPTSAAHNMIDILDDKGRVATAAGQTDNANKRTKKENWRSFFGTVGSTIGISAAISLLASSISPVIPVIGLLVSKLLMTFIKNRRINKRQGNDHSDTVEKNRAYDEEILDIVPKIEKFCEIVTNQREHILQQYKAIFADKTLNKKQKMAKYQDFVKDLVNKSLKEAGIDVQPLDLNAEQALGDNGALPDESELKNADENKDNNKVEESKRKKEEKKNKNAVTEAEQPGM